MTLIYMPGHIVYMTAFDMKKTSAFSAFEMIMVVTVDIFRILITGTFALSDIVFSDDSVIYKPVKISVDS